jgi:hypothetical protein
VFEFNDGDKVIRHYSVCVGQWYCLRAKLYLESMKVDEE